MSTKAILVLWKPSKGEGSHPCAMELQRKFICISQKTSFAVEEKFVLFQGLNLCFLCSSVLYSQVVDNFFLSTRGPLHLTCLTFIQKKNALKINLMKFAFFAHFRHFQVYLCSFLCQPSGPSPLLAWATRYVFGVLI